MDMDFAVIGQLVQRSRLYPVPVRRLACLLHASFRRRLATTPLRFANPSPPSGWIRDSHPQAEKHARHTKKNAGATLASALRVHFRINVARCPSFSSSKRTLLETTRARGASHASQSLYLIVWALLDCVATLTSNPISADASNYRSRPHQ